MKNHEKMAEPLHIQPLNDDLLANLSIEELEERLEMQILHLTEAQFCYDCETRCQPNCAPDCSPNCQPDCGPNCTTECFTNCTSDCSVDCTILI
jgi:hypothetical protein